jgi:hypothetical protein
MMSVVVLSEIMPSFAEVTAFGNVEQAVLDCAQATAWGSILMTVVMSSYMTLGKELEERVALTVFTKPIELTTFLMGKTCALITGIVIVFCIQGLMISRLGWIYGWETSSYHAFALTLWLILMQGIMILAVSTIASTLFKSTAAIWVTIGLWILPLFLPEWSFAWSSWILPMWVWFDFSYEIYHKTAFNPVDLLLLSSYSLLFSASWLGISAWTLSRRQF